MTNWKLRKLTTGSDDGIFHSHSYYDVNVMDEQQQYVAAHELRMVERDPTPEDAVSIGVVGVRKDTTWRPVGESRAWSWQQGPLTQWIPGSLQLVWNDREEDRFVARIKDVATDESRTLPAPIYAVDPHGAFALSLNMARLDSVRPGYGYPGGTGARLDEDRPNDDGVWKVDLQSGQKDLLLSLDRAVSFLESHLSPSEKQEHLKANYIYWFNHAKLSPNGQRFTVKLRFRSHDWSKEWDDQMGVSLTCGTDGQDLRLLARGTSHVIWYNDQQLYMWQKDGAYTYEDAKPLGRRINQLAPELIKYNVHIRHIPRNPQKFIFDTPYREEVDLFELDSVSGDHQRIATFRNHRPGGGPYRCDLHPCPSPEGDKIIVTSMDDGGRQVYLLERQ